MSKSKKNRRRDNEPAWKRDKRDRDRRDQKAARKIRRDNPDAARSILTGWGRP